MVDEDEKVCACFWSFLLCIIIIIILGASIDRNLINIIIFSITGTTIVGILIIGLISFYNWITNNCNLPRLILPTVNISISLRPQTTPSVTPLETCKMEHTEVTCTICMEDIEINSTCKQIPRCNHKFHSKCIEPWLKKNKTCPNCREEIT